MSSSYSYRFRTIAQFAKLAGLSKHHAEDLLHGFALPGSAQHIPAEAEAAG